MVFGSAGSSSSNNLSLLPNGTFVVELIIFIVVLGIVGKIILPPLQAAMDERARNVRAGLQAGEEGSVEGEHLAAARLEVLVEARKSAQAIVAEATAAAEASREAARTRGIAEHDRRIDEAMRVVELERKSAKDEALTHLGELVIAAAERVIGTHIELATHQQLIDDAVARTAASQKAVGS